MPGTVLNTFHTLLCYPWHSPIRLEHLTQFPIGNAAEGFRVVGSGTEV